MKEYKLEKKTGEKAISIQDPTENLLVLESLSDIVFERSLATIMVSVHRFITPIGMKVYIVGKCCRNYFRRSHYPEVTSANVPARPLIYSNKSINLCVESERDLKTLVDHLTSSFQDCTSSRYIKKISTSKETAILGAYKVLSYSPNDIMLEEDRFNPIRIDVIKNIEEDSLNREFCCNAIYFDITDGTFYDPTETGVEDAISGIIRSIKDPRDLFKEDPMSMIRCIKLSYQYHFEIEENTLDAIRWNPGYESIQPTLIYNEIRELVSTEKGQKPECGESSWHHIKYTFTNLLRFMHERELLKQFIPELEEGWNKVLNEHGQLDTLSNHLLAVVDWFQAYRQFSTEIPMSKLIDDDSYEGIVWSALLHDISKYKTFHVLMDGSYSYPEHEITSSQMARTILGRFNASESLIAIVETLIKHHHVFQPYWNRKTQSLNADKDTIASLVVNTTNKVSRFADLLHLIEANNHCKSPEYIRDSQVTQIIKCWSKETSVDELRLKPTAIPSEEIIERLGLTADDHVIIPKIYTILNQLHQLGNNRPSKEETMLDLYVKLFDKEFVVKKIEKRFVVMEEVGSNSRLAVPIDIVDSDDIDRLKKLSENVDDYGNLTINSLKFPNVYIRQAQRKMAGTLSKAVGDCIFPFQQMLGFNNMVITLDKYEGLAIKLRTEDNTFIGIF